MAVCLFCKQEDLTQNMVRQISIFDGYDQWIHEICDEEYIDKREDSKKMIKGVCVDTGYTLSLEKGKQYYLFPNGSNHFYVSNFPNEKAHMGYYEARLFEVIKEESWPEEPVKKEIVLDPDKRYKANLIWRKPGYKTIVLKDYFIKPNKTHVYFYHDSSFQDFCGCFPAHWFKGFIEVFEPKQVLNEFLEEESTEPDEIIHEQLTLF